MLKLKRENVSGVGAVKADFLLTNNLDQVCDFVSIPCYSLEETKLVPAPLDPKFNHLVLSAWYPGLGPNDIGRLFGKMKSRHSGSGPDSWSQWILDTDLATIQQEAEECKRQFLK